MKFAGIWKKMPDDKLRIFSEIIGERKEFGRGRVSLG